jgi:hypothetical protein
MLRNCGPIVGSELAEILKRHQIHSTHQLFSNKMHVEYRVAEATRYVVRKKKSNECVV